MGYSVMAVDASSHFSDDPYVYLKAPPLARASLVTLTHGSLSPMVSGTFLYVQNASAGGPVAWLLAEAVERARMHDPKLHLPVSAHSMHSTLDKQSPLAPENNLQGAKRHFAGKFSADGRWNPSASIVVAHNCRSGSIVLMPAHGDACTQALRWADGPSLLERMGLQLPGAFHEATQPDRLLSDAAASACLGFPVAWQSVWHDGASGEGPTRLGQRAGQVWEAHLQLMTEVGASSAA